MYRTWFIKTHFLFLNVKKILHDNLKLIRNAVLKNKCAVIRYKMFKTADFHI